MWYLFLNVSECVSPRPDKQSHKVDLGVFVLRNVNSVVDSNQRWPVTHSTTNTDTNVGTIPSSAPNTRHGTVVNDIGMISEVN